MHSGSSLRIVPVLLLPLVLGCFHKPAPEPVLVGHLVPARGPYRARGEQARQGVQLAVREATAAGRTVGGRPVNFVHVESRDEAEAVRGEVVRLVTVNHIAALLAGPEAEQAERGYRCGYP